MSPPRHTSHRPGDHLGQAVYGPPAYVDRTTCPEGRYTHRDHRPLNGQILGVNAHLKWDPGPNLGVDGQPKMFSGLDTDC